MAAAFRAGWSNSTPNAPQNWVTSTVAHDVLVLYCVDDNYNASLGSISGFVQQSLTHTGFDGQDMLVITKSDATGSEGTISLPATTGVIGGILAFSGCDNTTPMDVAAVSNTIDSGAASPYAISASITPSTNGCLIVALVGFDTNSSADPVATIATTAGTTGAWTKHQDLSAGFPNCAAFSCLQTTAGAVTVEITGTAAGSTAARSMVLLALRPASVGGGGGTTYNDTLSESVIAGDGYATALAALSAISEAVTADSAVSSAAVLPTSIAEAATLADAFSAANATASSIAEAMMVADAVTGAGVYAASIVETAVPADTYACTAIMAAAVAEAWTTGDSYSAAATYAAAVVESATLGDAYSTAGAQTYNDAFAEALAVSDALIAASAMHVAMAESITPADGLSVGTTFSVTVSEAALLADGTVGQWLITSSIAEAIAVADAHGATQAMAALLGEQVALLVMISDGSAEIPPTAPTDRIYKVRAENRTLIVNAQNRTYSA